VDDAIQWPSTDADAAGETDLDPEPDSAAPPPRRRRQIFQIAGRSVLALASAGVLAATAAGWTTVDTLRSRVPKSTVLAEIPQTPPADDGATDILLVGNDSRTDAQGNPLPLSVLKTLRTESTTGINTDTLILVRVPKDGGDPAAVSLPRDTYAPLGNGRSEKINGVYGLAKTARSRELERAGVPQSQWLERESDLTGQRALVQSVQALTGVRVDHYAEVNLLGFFEITNAVGGVEVCLNNSTRDKDSGAQFQAGRQSITGGDALAFVRQRHGLPRGDLDRIVRQQVFMAAVANKVLSTRTLADPSKLQGLMDAAQKSVVLDEGWDVFGFAQQMQGLAAGSVRFVTLPVAGSGTRDERGQSVLTVNPAQVHAFMSSLTTPTFAPEISPPRLGPRPLLRLDGSAHRQAPAISSGGIPCVN
jgi:LCP family protein required for cell wall assembly